MRRIIGCLSLLLSLVVSLPVHAEPDILVKGLFKNAAVLEINGAAKMLKSGQSHAGVKLISANTKGAVIEYEGKRRTLGLSQGIGANYSEASKTEVRLTSKQNGHFFGTALINGKSTQFMVDTGASSVAMSSRAAKRLGLRYENSPAIRVATAQGVTKGFQIKLQRVEIGGIRVNNVEATVIEGEYPLDVLLGNSYLSKVEMRIENGVLLMQSKF